MSEVSAIYSTALVTGASGWLGRSLVRLLAHTAPELKIRCFVLNESEGKALQGISQSISFAYGDVRNESDCTRFCKDARGAVLFHVAGIIHPRRVAEFYSINVDGARNIMTAARSAGVKRMVAVSSNSPCGCNPHSDHLFDERSPYHPYMNYGRSKMLMEKLVRESQGEIETVIVRAPWFYGPDQPPRQTLFFKIIREGKVPIVGSGQALRSMVYIDNLAQGLMLSAINSKAAGQIYWIADQRPYSMNEIVDTVERLLEKEFDVKVSHRRVKLPGFVSEIALFCDWCLQSIGLYHQKIHVLSEMNKTIACSIEKAKRELGYKPTVEIEEGMRRSIRWCFDHGIAL